MNATLNTRQLRLVGVAALVVVAAAGFLVFKQHKSSTATTTPAVTTPARTTPTHTTPAPAQVKLNTHGLPVHVALALRKHSVVVVALTQPGAGVDAIAAAEAQAGAHEMGAGFVAINVRRQRPGTAVLRKLGVLSTPTVLVVKRPGLVYAEFKGGFVDRDVVAQAVTDAR
ncbi:MAG TPA: hypothetical protein VJ814_09755 [Gaiellaceae bacterium]|nr:hypothetical protein [Gaiellaceae bacterium]